MEKLQDWYREVAGEWGECGRVACEDNEVLGFIKYAPQQYFPQAAHFPTGSPSDSSILIACIHIRDDARRHGLGRVLLQAALRDLSMRGERTVEAYALSGGGDMSAVPVMGVEFLLRHGFTVAQPHPKYPLLKLDLRSLAAWTENLEAVLESLRIPLGAPRRVPSPSIK
ncbi:MAG: GNAT family N-acetyltransferase [Coriobacteriia bacterium]|nr:GNAT family N-acetyltransferase [Coriobacteriia bacterium]